jgi:hypothetical protein
MMEDKTAPSMKIGLSMLRKIPNKSRRQMRTTESVG